MSNLELLGYVCYGCKSETLLISEQQIGDFEEQCTAILFGITMDEIVKEFNCKAFSTWSVYGKRERRGLHAQTFDPDKKEKTSQLDYIIGLMRKK